MRRILRFNSLKFASLTKRVQLTDLFLVCAASLVLILLLLVGDAAHIVQAVRAVVGLVFILFVPGYCVTTAIFVQGTSLSTPLRLGLSLGLSVTLVPLLAAVLDRTPWGVTTMSLFVAEVIVSICALVVALVRRYRLPAGMAFTPDLSSTGTLSRMLLLGIAGLGVLAIALSVLTPNSNAPRSISGPTEFYVLGRDGMARDYPTTVRLQEPISVTVGIVNHESPMLSFRTEVWVVDPFEDTRRAMVAQRDDIVLNQGETAEFALAWRMPVIGDDQRIEILLYEQGGTQPIRRLALRTNVVGEPDGR